MPFMPIFVNPMLPCHSRMSFANAIIFRFANPLFCPDHTCKLDRENKSADRGVRAREREREREMERGKDQGDNDRRQKMEKYGQKGEKRRDDTLILFYRGDFDRGPPKNRSCQMAPTLATKYQDILCLSLKHWMPKEFTSFQVQEKLDSERGNQRDSLIDQMNLYLETEIIERQHEVFIIKLRRIIQIHHRWNGWSEHVSVQ